MDQRFEQVLAAARSGADWAWAEIYREMSPAVLGYLRARRAADPEDLMGEVFLQVVRDLSRFDGDADAFRAWVFTVTHHRLLDAARRQRRRPRVETGGALDDRSNGVGDSEEDALAAIREQQIGRMTGAFRRPSRTCSC